MAPVERNELAGPVEPCSQSHDASPLILVDHVRNAGGGAMPLQNTSIKRCVVRQNRSAAEEFADRRGNLGKRRRSLELVRGDAVNTCRPGRDRNPRADQRIEQHSATPELNDGDLHGMPLQPRRLGVEDDSSVPEPLTKTAMDAVSVRDDGRPRRDRSSRGARSGMNHGCQYCRSLRLNVPPSIPPAPAPGGIEVRDVERVEAQCDSCQTGAV